VTFGEENMKTSFLTSLLLVSLTAVALADEPLWTDEQRLAKRDVVCVAAVVSTQRVSKIDQHNDLFLAVLKVEGMKKGKKTSVGSTFRVYYEFSPTGKNIRCPKYAELKKGDKGTFYLRSMTDDIRKHLGLKETKGNALFLEMGSDVKEKRDTEQPAAQVQSKGAPSRGARGQPLR
jgi:hypothetical protein